MSWDSLGDFRRELISYQCGQVKSQSIKSNDQLAEGIAQVILTCYSLADLEVFCYKYRKNAHSHSSIIQLVGWPGAHLIDSV